jgi:nucleotide-binding universal stress UspA family protein
MIGRILIPVDNDEPSSWAVQAAATLVAKFGSKVAMIHVFFPPFGVGPESAVMRPDITDEQMRRGRELLAKHHKAFPPGTSVEEVILVGQPPDQIVEYARKWGADLVIVASQQRRGLARLILGNVAEVVIRYSPCTVLVVRPKEEAEAQTTEAGASHGANLATS